MVMVGWDRVGKILFLPRGNEVKGLTSFVKEREKRDFSINVSNSGSNMHMPVS